MNEKLAVDTHTMPLDAELAKTYLESFDIRVGRDSDAIGGAASALGPMVGGAHLFVEPKNTARATALLQAYHGAQRVPGVQNYESADDLASRAFRTSLLGLVLFPIVMHIYAMVMLVKVPRRALSTKGRWHFAFAWATSVLVVTAAAAYLGKQFV
jgi:hypothetical protein